ncbi:MAG: transglycosylase SLT domain-containing protein [Pyrinomonadaceae bacterium]
MFAIPVVSVQAQVSSGSSAPYTLSNVAQNDPVVANIIAKAEKQFLLGQESLRASNPTEARAKFDGAIDAIVDSGIDVRGTPALQSYYLALIERIYQIETEGSSANAQNQVPVFGTQEYNPTADDSLGQVFLNQTEQNVTPDEIGDLQIATTGVDFKFTPNPLIQQYINFYSGPRGKRTMELGMQRSGKFMKMARKIFREEGVPEDITWLGQVESAWQIKAYSPAAAAGLWQFIPGTGVRWGLRQNAYVDERYSYEQATRASARYLKYLANRYNGNWELAMGAYNTGEGNIDRAISRTGVADFWAIYPYIAQETRNYVPTILAVMLIAKSPEKYGLGHIKPDAPMVYDVVQVPTATSLKLIADATNSSLEILRGLNPELRRDTTPRGEAYNVRIPAGSAQQFVATLKRVPVDRRETSNMNLVAVNKGEDWNSLATRTGITVSQLQEFNPGVDLNSATKIMTPKSQLQLTSIVRAKTPEATPAPKAAPAKPNTLKAQSGDTLTKMAARYGLNADELAKLNGISASKTLAAGTEIKTPAATKTTTTPSRRR